MFDWATNRSFWSFVSDEESIVSGQLNFWAMLETLLAIMGFWWLALHYETFFLLYTSLFVAPLLFLRCDQSERQGVEWADKADIYLQKWLKYSPARSDSNKRIRRSRRSTSLAITIFFLLWRSAIQRRKCI